MCKIWPLLRIMLLRNLEHTDPIQAIPKKEVCFEYIPGSPINYDDSDKDENILNMRTLHFEMLTNF